MDAAVYTSSKTLKQALMQAPVLSHPDLNAPFILELGATDRPRSGAQPKIPGKTKTHGLCLQGPNKGYA